ncbi:hypothetical protein GC1_00030 [Gluconobacter phage GC1]|uniref:Uncharacterized protein n=1 Tax=Gluconobacter phage GC1 TaxID=2047788 RepID=A0A2I5AR82_9VIRU|nr:hypothetical protein FDJ08_gp30 [Gluconobacter phage GC1]ATS92598.1 hypothetical protein GC1_00030 [Gluconobacter phage GC1]
MIDGDFYPGRYDETIADHAGHFLMRLAGGLVVMAVVLYTLSNVYRWGLADGAVVLKVEK